MTLTIHPEVIDLRKLNSLTKYPSILTYHKLGDRGMLTEELSVEFDEDDTVFLTEKIDGTNGRIILMPDGSWFIGSREELLTFSKDLIANPAMSIVEVLTPIANELSKSFLGKMIVFYLEVYGGKVTAASKQYTGNAAKGARLFDVQEVHAPNEKFNWSIEAIASWREANKQLWYDDFALKTLNIAVLDEAKRFVNCVPQICNATYSSVPKDVAGMSAFLKEQLPRTYAAIDADGGGKPEGLIIRNVNRRKIAKIRFEDYDRTLSKRRANMTK